MTTDQPNDDDQAALWNGSGAHAWIEAHEILDQIFRPFEHLLAEAAVTEGANRVLDVGCGTGSTTLALARALGTNGVCTGIDISEPMIAAALARASRDRSDARFICDDAQTHGFERASVDSIISRFGVMFFSDFVRAFANLRYAACNGALLRFIAWRDAAENTFMTTAERAAAPLLPNMSARRPNAPGQFAFADRNRVSRLLTESGWSGIDIEPLDVLCSFPESELVTYFTRLGPLGRILPQMKEPIRSDVIAACRAAFDPFVYGSEVRFVAACWSVSARAGDCKPEEEQS